MKKNMGGFDRVIRVILAALLTVLYFTHIVTGTAGIIALVFAGIFLLTAFISFCPLYTLFRVKTNKNTEWKP